MGGTRRATVVRSVYYRLTFCFFSCGFCCIVFLYCKAIGFISTVYLPFASRPTVLLCLISGGLLLLPFSLSVGLFFVCSHVTTEVVSLMVRPERKKEVGGRNGFLMCEDDSNNYNYS